MNRKKIQQTERFETARQVERDGRLKDAAKHYVLLLKKEPAHIQANSRLMMVYRKLHEFSKEVALIKNAVKALELETETKQQRYIDEHPEKAKASRALAQSLGLLSKKGYPLTENQTILKWQKRLPVVQKKLGGIKS